MGVEDFRISISTDLESECDIYEKINSKLTVCNNESSHTYRHTDKQGIVDFEIEKNKIKIKFAIGSKVENIYLTASVCCTILNDIGTRLYINEDDDICAEHEITYGEDTYDVIVNAAKKKRMIWTSVYGDNDEVLNCEQANIKLISM